MGRNLNDKKVLNGEVVPWGEPFEVTVKRWCRTALEQLRDSFAYQKIYKRGGSPAVYEIWRRKGMRTVYTYDRPYQKGRKRNIIGKKKVQWGWYDESKRREELQRRNPSADYWYSTGASFDSLAVDAKNFKEDEEFLVSGTVIFRSTMQLAYAEAGVGANGSRTVRGRGGIKVQRSIPYHAQERYIGEWTPKEGRTHRPSVRQQVNYLRRRMVWLADKRFQFKLNTWLVMTLENLVDPNYRIESPLGDITISQNKT